MTGNEAMAWEAFANVVMNFLGNHMSENYVEMVQRLVDTFKTLGANMSINLHYLHNHLDRFPENLGSMSKSKGKDSTRMYKKWNADIKADGMK